MLYMHDLSAFQRDILFVLTNLGQANGLEVKRQLKQYYDDEIHDGQLYPNMNTLIKKGLVNKSKYDGRTNSYELTFRGEREVEFRREWELERVDNISTSEQ